MTAPSGSRSALALALVLGALLAPPAHAAWPHGPGNNVRLRSVLESQYALVSVPDGVGGAIFAWQETYQGDQDIFVQRIGADGTPMWGSGVDLTYIGQDQTAPAIVSDGQGGAFVAWQDLRLSPSHSNIYAQHVNASGLPLWTTNGVPVCTLQATLSQYTPVLAVGNGGGVYVAWLDGRSGVDYAMYAQLLNAAGAPMWTTNGIALCSTLGASDDAIVPDGSGNAFAAWTDYRSGNRDIYLQKVTAAGTLSLGASGLGIVTATGDQDLPVLLADNVGGVFVAWEDTRSGTSDIYLQHASSNGNPSFAANGLAVCTAAAAQTYPAMASDGLGGVVLAWADMRVGPDPDIYAQRVSYEGTPAWTANGVVVCSVPGGQGFPVVLADGVGGVIVAWADARADRYYDLYAQRLNASGTAQWTASGAPVCTVSTGASRPVIVNDAGQGAILAWSDDRLGTPQTYAQRVDEWGMLGAEPAIASVRDVPNDQGGLVKLSWNASPLDTDPLFRSIASYYLYRSAPPTSATTSRAQALPAAALGSFDAAREPHRLAVTRTAAATYYWEYLGSETANHLPTYSSVVATTGDSVAGSNPRTAFLVEARNSGGSQWWYSQPDSGYSVDNLPPSAPSPFTAQYERGVTALAWGASPAGDLAGYRLYRGDTPAFATGSASLVASPTTTSYVDSPGRPCFYKLSAVDVHGNEGPCAFVQPSGTTDAPGPEIPTEVFLARPAPCPASEGALVGFGLPREGRALLALYDPQGRLVRTLADGALAAGVHAVRWDGLDACGHALPAGVYLCRLDALGRRFVSRLIVVR